MRSQKGWINIFLHGLCSWGTKLKTRKSPVPATQTLPGTTYARVGSSHGELALQLYQCQSLAVPLWVAGLENSQTPHLHWPCDLPHQDGPVWQSPGIYRG